MGGGASYSYTKSSFWFKYVWITIIISTQKGESQRMRLGMQGLMVNRIHHESSSLHRGKVGSKWNPWISDALFYKFHLGVDGQMLQAAMTFRVRPSSWSPRSVSGWTAGHTERCCCACSAFHGEWRSGPYQDPKAKNQHWGTLYA